MNVIFVEPAFPANQRQFVRGLAAVGATVIGIGERPGDWLDDELRGWMQHYHQIGSVTDTGALRHAVEWIQDKVWVDRLEATVEAHILSDGRGARGLSHPRHQSADRLAVPGQALDEGGRCARPASPPPPRPASIRPTRRARSPRRSAIR